ncbi:MAG: GNAT family N-acetyltransferase [Bacteroidota bacterium]
MDVTIRQATPRDAAAITRFNSLMAQETEGRTLDSQRLLEGVEALLRDPSKGIYYLAESQGAAAGQLMITYEWSDWRNGNFWWIQSVYVEKDFRGKGVFKTLYHHVRQLARADKTVCGLRLYVERQNERAQRAYEQLGMKKAHYEMYELDFVL